MYPAPRGTPGTPGEYDQYPLQESSFSSQPINRGTPGYQHADPFDDNNTPYSDSMNQPLLHSPAPSPSPGGYFDNNSGVKFAPPASPTPHYGEAPRRQPRRYKTST
jgi:chitin synthase